MKHYFPGKFFERDQVNIDLAGCGGTGSQLLTGLARLDHALKALGHPGLNVRVFDPDVVTEANVGRQSFSPYDIGQHKAVVLVTRINQFMGLSWEAYPVYFNGKLFRNNNLVFFNGRVFDILVTAVDSAKARTDIGGVAANAGYGYWLDTGNTRDTGQVVLGTLREIKQPSDDCTATLPTIAELYDLRTVKEKDSGPSCSLEAALKQQDLMVNTMTASWALHLLWEGFRKGFLTNHGCFVDLKTYRVNPLPIDPAVWKRMKGGKEKA
ncbi:MAG: hypothetical protein A2X99_02270 [Deltaproteobacteria bacterium GWB2_55_19]|nr:MAG: hypothetical protein A2X99_02270 [Deltaproteobacteria bacterium GWB2_55_19]